jgi:hypothetical protein
MIKLYHKLNESNERLHRKQKISLVFICMDHLTVSFSFHYLNLIK